AERRLEQVQGNRDKLERSLEVLQADVRSAKQFNALAERARVSLHDVDAKASARDAYAAAMAARGRLEAEVAELQAEHRQAEGRRDNVPEHLQRAREVLARAAGLSAEDLPFVGELIEVRTEFEPWREAFNLALGGFATTLLIDAEDVAGFRAAINATRVPVRLNYEGVPTGMTIRELRDARILPGRLDFRRTKFTGWLQERLEERFEFVCVDNPGELNRHRKALTITGQVSQGNRGAHGGQGRANVLGFSNQRRLADLAAHIQDARVRLLDAI